MRLANGIVIDKEATFGALKFSALRREIHLQNEDGSVSEEIDYSNKKRLNRTGLWDFIRSRHHKRSKKTYDFKRAYLLSVTQTGQGSQRSCGRIARDYFY